ncbi:MAG TPA: acyl carrier protein phosphodiesterase, partial [Rhodanobacteraceae bacterium]|nr:acyl carrier protein phosphodiesterase [Rhodanobacteraceae bacterium]
FRRYAGILLDVWFDHLLVLGWDRIVADEPLDAFSQRWLALLEGRACELPASLRAFIRWMQVHGLPAAYGEEPMLAAVFHGLSRRLSRPSPVADALPALHAHADALQQHFDAFFPDLVAHAHESRRDLLD